MWTSFFASRLSLYNDLIIICAPLSKMNNFTTFSHIQAPDFRFIIGSPPPNHIGLWIYNEVITIQTFLHKNIFSKPFSCVFWSLYPIFNQLILEGSHSVATHVAMCVSTYVANSIFNSPLLPLLFLLVGCLAGGAPSPHNLLQAFR